MTPEEREQLLDKLIDFMAVSRTGGGRRDVMPFVEVDGAFGFYLGKGEEAAATAHILTSRFEKGGLAPNRSRSADYDMYRNMQPGAQIQAGDFAHVSCDEDGEVRFECRAPQAAPQLLELLDSWIAEAMVTRRREARYELAQQEKKIDDRRRDRVAEVFSAQADSLFVSAYLEQVTEAAFSFVVAEVTMKDKNDRWPSPSAVVATDLSTNVTSEEEDRQIDFKWKLSQVFTAAGAVNSHSEEQGLFAYRVTGKPARLALDILDHDPAGARKAAEAVVKDLGAGSGSFMEKFEAEAGKRSAEQAVRQGTAKPITVHSPLKLKSTQ